jgi:hypothetical protein
MEPKVMIFLLCYHLFNIKTKISAEEKVRTPYALKVGPLWLK